MKVEIEKEDVEWITNRIKSEYQKHNKSGLDWAKIAAIKIVRQLMENDKYKK